MTGLSNLPSQLNVFRNKLRIWRQETQKEIETFGDETTVRDSEYQHVALTVAMAILNPRRVEWDVERFQERVKGKRIQIADVADDMMMGENLQKFFRQPDVKRLSEPATTVDMHGHILVWYLPGVLGAGRVNSVNDATQETQRLLQKSLEDGERAGRNVGWRIHPKLFSQTEVVRGCFDLSPGWFMQAQERTEDNIHASRHLGTSEAAVYLQKTIYVEQLLNAVVAITTPALFQAGMQAVKKVKDMKLGENGTIWSSIYSAMSVIVNRQTPKHRDDGGALSHPDLLFSAGKHTDAELRLPDVGTILQYDPGTAVMITGRALEHAVPKTWNGHRICVAHYIKDKVHDRLNIGRPPLANMKDYDALKAPGYSSRVEGKMLA